MRDLTDTPTRRPRGIPAAMRDAIALAHTVLGPKEARALAEYIAAQWLEAVTEDLERPALEDEIWALSEDGRYAVEHMRR